MHFYLLNMAPKLYIVTSSPAVRAVLIVSEVMGLKLDTHVIDLKNGDHLKEDFIKMNPLHTVPTLDDDGTIVYDSHVINIYLYEKYGKDDKLYPKDLNERVLVHHGMAFDLGYLFPVLRTIIKSYLYKTITALTPNILERTKYVYDLLETILKRTKWIGGDQICLADISCYTTITSLDYHVPIKSNEYPSIVNWLENCKKMPYFKNDVKYLNNFYDLMKNSFNAEPYQG